MLIFLGYNEKDTNDSDQPIIILIKTSGVHYNMVVNIHQKQKILILSGDFGDGHKQAAQAILDDCQLNHPNVDVEVVDFMEWTHPHLHSVGKFCYIQWVKKFPSVYGYLFQKTRNDNLLSSIFKKIRSFSLSRMIKLLNEKQPSVIVSTFPSAAAAMSILKIQGLTFLPTITVITDHTDHSYWIHPFTDRYLVASEQVNQALQRQNILSSQIEVTGIPLRACFNQTFDRDLLRERHNLRRDLSTVMVMGGGLGMIDKEFIRILQSDDLPTPMQFVIICGHNMNLKRDLEEKLLHSKHSVKVTGYINYVHEMMALSDLIVTKPGGLTTSEALAMELPMLLYKALPGQERDNSAFLLRAGVAVQAENSAELLDHLIKLFKNPLTLFKLKDRAKQFQKKAATAQAVRSILQIQVEPSLPLSPLATQRYTHLFFKRKLRSS